MLPKQLDLDAWSAGRPSRGRGDRKVGNFFRRERATTITSHFDMQVPTRYGWVFREPLYVAGRRL